MPSYHKEPLVGAAAIDDLSADDSDHWLYLSPEQLDDRIRYGKTSNGVIRSFCFFSLPVLFIFQSVWETHYLSRNSTGGDAAPTAPTAAGAGMVDQVLTSVRSFVATPSDFRGAAATPTMTTKAATTALPTAAARSVPVAPDPNKSTSHSKCYAKIIKFVLSGALILF